VAWQERNNTIDKTTPTDFKHRLLDIICKAQRRALRFLPACHCTPTHNPHLRGKIFYDDSKTKPPLGQDPFHQGCPSKNSQKS